MDRQPTLETERLILRPLTEDDREALYEVASDPAVWEQHPIHDRWRREVFDAFFDDALASGGALAVVDRRDDGILGSTRYDRYDPDEGGVVEIGWTFLAPRCWGKGINPEMKRAMLAHAFAHVAVVEFRVGDTNYRSRNALEAIGAERTTRYELEKYQGKRVVHLVYEITRESFADGPLM
ncbi:GNAT family N-acetyltransferase [Erythrobacter sp.]|uniref:GNAT family N-acetyltransferase n=1 Tax=Erythrobacter sp. TaxID=1042 RepID=UPI001B1F8549|nr:GNAT family N-acetyltransferase [Erythrobacter sp.]MBO6526664.1 GNAT family N-acetyltransferase [Erythrobacter sp.]MBO6529126.1 GNAT family N-acetyltransferase [Erythrobacter sp.]